MHGHVKIFQLGTTEPTTGVMLQSKAKRSTSFLDGAEGLEMGRMGKGKPDTEARSGMAGMGWDRSTELPAVTTTKQTGAKLLAVYGAEGGNSTFAFTLLVPRPPIFS